LNTAPHIVSCCNAKSSDLAPAHCTPLLRCSGAPGAETLTCSGKFVGEVLWGLKSTSNAVMLLVCLKHGRSNMLSGTTQVVATANIPHGCPCAHGRVACREGALRIALAYDDELTLIRCTETGLSALHAHHSWAGRSSPRQLNAGWQASTAFPFRRSGLHAH
jgi:hypothetical protein